ncbi:hypothetical protein HOH87_04430 [bacterium]|nr:hypothetical protein [bacterium]
MLINSRFLLLIGMVGVATLLSSCQTKDSVNVYFTPKEPIITFTQLKQTQSGLTWTTPKQWKENYSHTKRIVTFVIDDSTQVTVTRFEGRTGSLIANVNRWRGQLKLGPTRKSRLKYYVSYETFNRKKFTVVKLRGPRKQKPRQGLITAFAKHNNDTWFIKLSGPNRTVLRQRRQFMEFVSNVQFH